MSTKGKKPYWPWGVGLDKRQARRLRRRRFKNFQPDPLAYLEDDFFGAAHLHNLMPLLAGPAGSGKGFAAREEAHAVPSEHRHRREGSNASA